MKELSKEQIETRDAVRAMCRKLSNKSISESVEGHEEIYILMRIGHVELFLYQEGEANIKVKTEKTNNGKAIDWRYELADYKGVGELRSELLNDLSELVQV